MIGGTISIYGNTSHTQHDDSILILIGGKSGGEMRKKNKVSKDSSQCLSSLKKKGVREVRPGASGSGSTQEIGKRVYGSWCTYWVEPMIGPKGGGKQKVLSSMLSVVQIYSVLFLRSDGVHRSSLIP